MPEKLYDLKPEFHLSYLISEMIKVFRKHHYKDLEENSLLTFTEYQNSLPEPVVNLMNS